MWNKIDFRPDKTRAASLLNGFKNEPLEAVRIPLYKCHNLYVIFHKRVRVFYQRSQTRENNENHEVAARVIFIVLVCF